MASPMVGSDHGDHDVRARGFRGGSRDPGLGGTSGDPHVLCRSDRTSPGHDYVRAVAGIGVLLCVSFSSLLGVYTFLVVIGVANGG